MKKLLFAIILLTAVSCTNDYKEIKPKKISGVEYKIDSTKWTPALIQTEPSKITVYESGELREITLWDESVVMWAVFSTVACLLLFVGLLTSRD